MKTLRNMLWLLLVPTAFCGCGESFPDEEMHLGLENKTRPFTVIVDPPEAAPGQTVSITLLAHTPNPEDLDITWRVAQDFDRGLYETDEVERNYLVLDPPEFTTDEDGFLTHTFQWVVPDSALLLSSALPQILTDPVTVTLAEELIGQGAGNPPTKEAVDAWLKNITADEVAAQDPQTRQAIWALADRFACQVRFRAVLHSDLIVDVTRNLTIRQTSRLFGPNTNENAQISRLAVVALQKSDALEEDLEDPQVPQTWYYFYDRSEPIATKVEVPRYSDWTYFLVTGFFPEQYTSPFNLEMQLSEQGSYRWYYYRQDDPTSSHQFFAAEDGTEAEMWNLDHVARIIPAGVGSAFRFALAIRDERGEWVSFNGVPGGSEYEGIVEFVEP